MALLEVKNMGFRYYGSSYEIRSVNLTLSKGQRLIVYGRDGSGKTTLLRLLCGLEEYGQGGILLEGQELSKLPYKDMDIGYTFDRSILDGKAAVGDVISQPMKLRGLSEDVIKAYLDSLEEKLLLPTSTQVKDLSDTQVAMLILARLFAVERRLYLVDDVWKDLDGQGKELVVSYLQENIQGKSVIIATAEENLARRMATDGILVLTASEVAPTLTLEEITVRPINMQSAILAGYELHIGVLVKQDERYFASISDLLYQVAPPMSEIYVGKKVCFAISRQGEPNEDDEVGDGKVMDFYYDLTVGRIIS